MLPLLPDSLAAVLLVKEDGGEKEKDQALRDATANILASAAKAAAALAAEGSAKLVAALSSSPSWPAGALASLVHPVAGGDKAAAIVEKEHGYVAIAHCELVRRAIDGEGRGKEDSPSSSPSSPSPLLSRATLDALLAAASTSLSSLPPSDGGGGSDHSQRRGLAKRSLEGLSELLRSPLARARLLGGDAEGRRARSEVRAVAESAAKLSGSAAAEHAAKILLLLDSGRDGRHGG